MRQIKLLSWQDFPEHLENIKKSLEIVYETNIQVDSGEIAFDQLYPTEEFLEKDKLTLILRKIIDENYNVPIIIEKHRQDYFILDGHHRSFIQKKLMSGKIRSWILIFPETGRYRTHPKRPLENLPIRDVGSIDDPILKAWSMILTLVKYYEALYDVSFNLMKREIPLNQLVPTQPQVFRRQIHTIRKLLVPISCVEYLDKFYILDGHARALRAKQLKLCFIRAVVLTPISKVRYGIVKTSAELNLEDLEDIKIL